MKNCWSGLPLETFPVISILVLLIQAIVTFLEPDLLKGYTVNIRAALWSKDGKFVYSGGEDKAMRYVPVKM